MIPDTALLDATNDIVSVNVTNESVGLLEPVSEAVNLSVANELVGLLEPVEEPIQVAVTSEAVGVIEVTPEVISVVVESSGPVALGGDLGGTSPNGYVKTVRGVSSSLTYDGNGRLSTVTTAIGTKTMTYNPDGTMAGITGTGSYKSKTFTYAGGKLSAVEVS